MGLRRQACGGERGGVRASTRQVDRAGGKRWTGATTDLGRAVRHTTGGVVVRREPRENGRSKPVGMCGSRGAGWGCAPHLVLCSFLVSASVQLTTRESASDMFGFYFLRSVTLSLSLPFLFVPILRGGHVRVVRCGAGAPCCPLRSVYLSLRY